jgi:hypothetical protein
VAAIAAALLAHRDRTGRASMPQNGSSSNGGTATAQTDRAPAARDAWKQAARREAVGDR